MTDRYRPYEPITAAKLNRTNAAINSYDASGVQIEKSGTKFTITQPDPKDIESFWVTLDEEHQVAFANDPARKIYKYSWTEVAFDPASGYWFREEHRKGDYRQDPVMQDDPSAKITGWAKDAGTIQKGTYKKSVSAKQVYPVVRDPFSGALLFFSRRRSGGDCPPSGLYKAMFARLPTSFVFEFTPHNGINPGPKGNCSLLPSRYSLANKSSSALLCGRFDKHVATIYAPDGTVWWQQTYTADNPCPSIEMDIPDGTYRAEMKVFLADKTILQEFSLDKVKPGDTSATPAMDVKYVTSVFDSFVALTYAQTRYVCSGFAPPCNVQRAPDTGLTWPAPSLVWYKDPITSIDCVFTYIMQPQAMPIGPVDIAAAQALLNLVNKPVPALTRSPATKPREPVSTYGGGSVGTLVDTVVINGVTYWKYAKGDTEQHLSSQPNDCSISTSVGFTKGSGGFYIRTNLGYSITSEYDGFTQSQGECPAFVEHDYPNPTVNKFSAFGYDFRLTHTRVNFNK